MMRLAWLNLALALPAGLLQAPSGDEILKKVDENMFSDTKIVESRMVIRGRRETRTVESRTWQRGTNESFTEYLAPARERGTKMLKLKDMLWEYSPSTDRTIMISGHLLRQSVMGSDLSYEDMMDDPHLPNMYSATIASEESIEGRKCWVLDLHAKKEDIAYDHRSVWVDQSRYVLLKENLYAKSGKLLKTIDVREVMRVQNHWLAKSVLYRDVLKEGDGTEFYADSVKLDVAIPDYLLSKAALRR
ncbi:MAG TPA: outer membrane lipoprotein-sorting protein [Bacteroidota bacterium]|nr:outer membrane lipoprotein-sorting protein [Bacteroidota bacterium]